MTNEMLSILCQFGAPIELAENVLGQIVLDLYMQKLTMYLRVRHETCLATYILWNLYVGWTTQVSTAPQSVLVVVPSA